MEGISMADIASRFHFASAPDSWGVLDYPGPSWNQSYEKMLDEMVEAGYTGTELGPDGFFHPDVATSVETAEECERFFDVTAKTGIGLCLDTGHAVYGGADAIAEAEKYRSILRFVHLKDCDDKVLAEARRKHLTFDQAIEEKVFTIIGKGSIDFPAFFRVLEKNNYSGWMVVEQDVKFGATVIPPAQSIAASLRYLRGVVQELAGTTTR